MLHTVDHGLENPDVEDAVPTEEVAGPEDGAHHEDRVHNEEGAGQEDAGDHDDRLLLAEELAVEVPAPSRIPQNLREATSFTELFANPNNTSWNLSEWFGPILVVVLWEESSLESIAKGSRSSRSDFGARSSKLTWGRNGIETALRAQEDSFEMADRVAPVDSGFANQWRLFCFLNWVRWFQEGQSNCFTFSH